MDEVVVSKPCRILDVPGTEEQREQVNRYEHHVFHSHSSLPGLVQECTLLTTTWISSTQFGRVDRGKK